MSEMKQTLNAKEEDRQKRVGIWAAIIFASLGLVFVIFWMVNVLILQKGHADPSDIILLPVTILMLLAGLGGYLLIRRDRLMQGLWLVYLSVLIPPVIVTLVYENIYTITFSYLAVFATLSIGWVFPRGVRRSVIIATVVPVLAIMGIEVWHPAFRETSINLENFAPYAIGVGGLALLGFFIRQAIEGNLRTKLVTAFIGTSLIALVSLGVYFNIRLRDVLTQNTKEHLTQEADQTALYVDTFIGNQLKSVSVESQNPLYIDFMYHYSTQSLDSREVPNVSDALKAAAQQDATFINSYALLSNTGVVAIDSATSGGVDESQAAFIKDAITKNQVKVTGPIFDQKSGKASLYFSAPIKNQAGANLGVLVVDYNADVIESLVESLIPNGNPDALLFRVVDKNNLIRIAHTAKLSLLYKPYKNLAPDQIVRLQSQGLLPPGSAQDVLAGVENDTVAGLENTTQSTYFETTSKTLSTLTLNTVAPMKTVPWLAFIRQSNVTVTAPLDQQTRTVVIISLVLLGLVTLAAIGLSQILTSPILRLVSVTRLIAEGNMQAQARVESKDEIGLLAGSINVMSGQVWDLINRLEQRVADRTKALATSAEVSRRLSRSINPKQLAVDVVEQIQTAFHYYHAHIYFLDDATGDLVMAGGTGEAGATMLARGHKIQKGRGLVGRAAETNAPVLVKDVSQAVGWLPNPLLPDTKSEVAIPISAGEQVLGVLDVQQNVFNGLGEDDVSLLQSIAGQVSISLQNARAFEASQAKAQLESMANAIGQKIQRTTSTEDTLQTAIREIGLALGASRVTASIGISRKGNGNGTNGE